MANDAFAKPYLRACRHSNYKAFQFIVGRRLNKLWKLPRE